MIALLAIPTKKVFITEFQKINRYKQAEHFSSNLSVLFRLNEPEKALHSPRPHKSLPPPNPPLHFSICNFPESGVNR